MSLAMPAAPHESKKLELKHTQSRDVSQHQRIGKKIVGAVFSRRSKLEGMVVRKGLIPLAESYGIVVTRGAKKQDLIDRILRYETQQKNKEIKAALALEKKQKREQRVADKQAARLRREEERNKETGFNRKIQAAMEAKASKAKKSNELDLGNSADPWAFRYDLKEIPDFIIEAFKQRTLNVHQGLQKLWLTNNKLRAVRDDVRFLRNLRVLGLENNELTELPAAIGQLEMLSEIHCGRNQLSGLPDEIVRCKHLMELDLSKNAFVAMPMVLMECKSLRSLRMAHNGLRAVPSEIMHLRNLYLLDLDHNLISKLPHELGRIKNISSIGLAFNHLGQEPHFLVEMPNLVECRLEGNRAESYTVRHPLSGLVVPDAVMPFRLVDGVMQTREGKHKMVNGKPAYYEEELKGYVSSATQYTRTNACWFLRDHTEEHDMLKARAAVSKKARAKAAAAAAKQEAEERKAAVDEAKKKKKKRREAKKKKQRSESGDKDDKEQRSVALEIFVDTHGRDPSEEELSQLMDSTTM